MQSTASPGTVAWQAGHRFVIAWLIASSWEVGDWAAENLSGTAGCFLSLNSDCKFSAEIGDIFGD
jgi:hypothetical protein